MDIATNVKKKKPLIHDKTVGYLFIAPFYIFLLVFVLIPIGFNVFYSFTNYNLRSASFVGISNYQFVFSDTVFRTSFKNTVVYTVTFVLLNMLLGFLLANVLNNQKLIGTRFIRTCFFAPYVCSMVSASLIWMWMYQPQGTFNSILSLFGQNPSRWLYDVNLALGCIIFVSVWKSVGYYMLIFLAGFQNIPESVLEAALIDGANTNQMIRYIKIPLLRPVTFFLTVTGTINSFSTFEIVELLTQGGPMNSTTTVAHQIYLRAFRNNQFGISSAQSVVLMIIVFIFIILNFRYGSQGEDIEVG